MNALLRFVDRHSRLFVLTGAGCSTDSGIPDYRDGQPTFAWLANRSSRAFASVSEGWKRRPPIMFQAFVANERARKRYWARSLAGFRRLRRARPNEAHYSLSSLERCGRITQLVTQNVDGLHQAAGSKNVIDLHGRIDTVRCLSCNQRTSRQQLQLELERRNPAFTALDAVEAPDGDADLENVAFETFDVPACGACGGLLKPDVVFFGEGVPKARVHRAMDAIECSDAMLVVGSSLMVYSGYRFVQAMADAGKPIVAINLGRTRADTLLTLKITDRCATALRVFMRRSG